MLGPVLSTGNREMNMGDPLSPGKDNCLAGTNLTVRPSMGSVQGAREQKGSTNST